MRRTILDHRGDVVSEVVTDADQVHWIMKENVVPQLESTARWRGAYQPHRREVYRPIANVPESVVAQALTEGWFHDKKRWKNWANDIHNKNWRIAGGRF